MFLFRSAETNAESSGEDSGQTSGDQEGNVSAAVYPSEMMLQTSHVLWKHSHNVSVVPAFSASDEPNSVLRGREQEPGRAGGPADPGTAPPAGQRGANPPAAGATGNQE